MKIINLKKVSLGLTMLFFGSIAYSQSHVTMSLENVTSTINSIEYDLYIVNDGTTPLKLAGCSYGVNFNPAIIQDGQIIFNYHSQTRVRSLDGLKPYSIASVMSGNRNQVRMISTPVSINDAPLLAQHTPFKIGHFSMHCEHAWVHNSQPNFQLQAFTKPGLTTTQVLVYEEDKRSIRALTPTQYSVQLEVNGNPILNPIQVENEGDVTTTHQNQTVKNIMSSANESRMTIYPNPASDMMHLEISSNTSSRVYIKISDFHGRVIKQIQSDIQSGLNNVNLDISAFASGIYTIQVKDNSTIRLNQTFTKQ